MLKVINNAAEQNMKKSGQAGFHLIEVIIIVVVIGVLGFIGWYVYQSQTSTKKNNTQPTSAPKQTLPTNSQTSQTPAAPVDPYAGWKTYTSPAAGYSIKYPSDWTVRTGTNNGGAEDNSIISPNYFEIQLLSFSKSSAYWLQPGSSDECGAACLSINSTTPVSIPNYGTINITATTAGVGGGAINELRLLTPTNTTLLASPTKTGIYTISWGVLQRQTERQLNETTPSQFLATPDVVTAIQIYKSLSY